MLLTRRLGTILLPHIAAATTPSLAAEGRTSRRAGERLSAPALVVASHSAARGHDALDVAVNVQPARYRALLSSGRAWV